ncbi:hypothetical protein ACNKHQ_13590 [Shigella flexneri]
MNRTRYSGRTAMRANISVHEPRQPQDKDAHVRLLLWKGTTTGARRARKEDPIRISSRLELPAGMEQVPGGSGGEGLSVTVTRAYV